MVNQKQNIIFNCKICHLADRLLSNSETSANIEGSFKTFEIRYCHNKIQYSTRFTSKHEYAGKSIIRDKI